MFNAKLKVDGKELIILHCHYELFQETDVTGRPSSVTRGGKITVTVESTGEPDFFEWMTNSTDRKDGTIEFLKRDSDSKNKELKFTEAYLVSYKENFDHTGSNPVTETFTMSAKILECGNGKHENKWV